MSEDDADRRRAVSRRKMLAMTSAVATGGIGGCSNDFLGTATGPSNPNTTTTDAVTETATETETKTETEPVYSGETIPPTSYAEGNIPPTVAAPSPEVTNPVLTAADVTDFGNADYVADPFMFVEEGTWHMFFEVSNHNRSPDAAIAHATSADGLEWTYDKRVLEKREHTSFPYVLKWQGEYYMSPPTGKTVKLWRATSFPDSWEEWSTAVSAEYYTHDPVFFRWNDRWWLFTDRGNEDVVAFHANSLDADEWTPHEQNPVVTDRRKAARQGGRPVVVGDELYLFFQDLEYEYGSAIRPYRVGRLTPTAYEDEEAPSSPVIAGFGSGWNSRKMHQFDPWSLGEGNGWRCSVDGYNRQREEWSIGIFDVPPAVTPSPDRIPVGAQHSRGYYDLGADAGVAVDHSGSHNHGMIRGTTPSESGPCGGRRFGDARDRLVVTTGYPEALGTDSFTIVANGTLTEASAPQALFSYTSRHVPYRLAVHYDATEKRWEFDLNGKSDRVQPRVETDLTPGTPFQLSLSYRAGEGYRIFQDGNELTQTRDVGDAYHEVCLFVLGATLPGQFPWQGSIHRLGVFDSVLSKADLTTLAERACQEN